MIRFEQVGKTYGDTRALDGVDFTVDQGEFTFLVGPSGSGKTTVLRLLTRELLPDSGTVRIAGADLSRLPPSKIPALRRMVASVPQDHRLLANRTVRENLAFSLSVLGWRRRAALERIDDLLGLVGLPDHGSRYPHELSGGERQRIAIARAVAGGPVVLLADEPTGNLDPVTSVGIVRLLDAIADAGTTVVMSTHDHSVVDAMRRRVIALEHGRVVRHARGGYAPGGALLRAGGAR